MSKRFAAFQHTAYTRYFLARFSIAFAAQILAVSVGWQMWAVTREATMLALIGLVLFLPGLCLVLFTGLAADKFGRRRVMGIAASLEALCALIILILAATGRFSAAPVLGALFVLGVGRAFFGPAAASLAVNVVPKADFPNAVAWNSSSWQAATIVGPVAGGLLYGWSPVIAYSAALALMLMGTVLIIFIPKPRETRVDQPVSIELLLGGLKFIFKEKVVLGAISLDLFAVLLGGAVALLPIYASDILDLGPTGLGLLRSAPGIGAIAMVGILTSFTIRRHAGLIMFASVGLFGLATTIFGLSNSAWMSIAALMAVGAFDMVSVYVRGTVLQLWTPDALRGRVNAVNSVFLGASNELGEFRAGMMAHWLGPVAAVALGGIAAMGVAGAWAGMFPKLRKTQTLDAPDGVD